jgi:hypothetical protein
MTHTQDPTINTSSNHDLGCPEDFCGNVIFGVNFSLGSQATTCGWIVQHVIIDLYTPDGKTNLSHQEWWEAWHINPQQTSTKGLYGQFDDSYTTAHSRNTAMVQKWQGIARFYEGTLTSDFVYCNPMALSGSLWSTASKPAWWALDALQGGTESGTAHNLTINWDCTAGGTKCDVPTVPADACDNPCKLQ